MAVWRLEGVSVPEKRFAAKSAQTFRLPLVKCEDEYKIEWSFLSGGFFIGKYVNFEFQQILSCHKFTTIKA